MMLCGSFSILQLSYMRCGRVECPDLGCIVNGGVGMVGLRGMHVAFANHTAFLLPSGRYPALRIRGQEDDKGDPSSGCTVECYMSLLNVCHTLFSAEWYCKMVALTSLIG